MAWLAELKKKYFKLLAVSWDTDVHPKPATCYTSTVGSNGITVTSDKYYFERDNDSNKTFKKFLDRYVCPCCGYPTLEERMCYEICGLCDWEDDGQDDQDADRINGGPNGDYSLTEARMNFRTHLTMYRAGDINFNHLNRDRIKEIKELYDALIVLSEEREIKEKLRQVTRLERRLRK